MRALIWDDNGTATVRNVSKPVIGSSDEVLVKVSSVGICGTDLTIYNGDFPKNRLNPPLILGHEFSGKIEKIGENGTSFGVGERVVINPLLSCNECYPCVNGDRNVCCNLKVLGVDIDGALAEYVCVPEKMLHRLPDSMSYDEGALVEPLAVAVHAIRKSDLQIGDSILVVGGGPIGILLALSAEIAGAGKVVIAEVQDYRINFLRNNGFEVFNPLADDPEAFKKDSFEGIGANVVFEATGTEVGFQLAVNFGRISSVIVEVGVPKKAMNLELNKLNFAELKIVGSRVYTSTDFKIAIEHLLSQIKIRPKMFQGFVKNYTLDECDELLRNLGKSDSEIIKAIVNI